MSADPDRLSIGFARAEFHAREGRLSEALKTIREAFREHRESNRPKVTDDSPLEDLGLGPQLTRPLVRHGYQTVGRIKIASDKELLSIRSMYPARVLKIDRALAAAGMQRRANCLNS